jgi:hypothetical protein
VRWLSHSFLKVGREAVLGILLAAAAAVARGDAAVSPVRRNLLRTQ